MMTAHYGAAITWNSADFAWHDADAGKSWHTAHIAAYTLTPAETIALRAADSRAPYLAPTESAHLTESTRRTTTLLHPTHLTLADTHTPRTVCRRTFGETITADERAAKHTARTETRHLALRSACLTPWQGILSSITLTDDLTDEAWQSTSASPSGYEAFHPFAVGEYTYRDALVRILLTTGAAGTDPLLCDVRFHVDIEDTRESGIADCTQDAPSRITLTRRFHHTPRIVLTVLGADTDALLIPRLIAQDITDGVRTFDCELLRTDGTRTNGTIAWLAEGY